MTDTTIPTRALANTAVFKPITVGKVTLSSRVVYAPTTRFRALDDHSPSDLAYQYYDDRSKYPGSLIISEGTIPSPKVGTYGNVPGIYTDKHVEAWRKINEKIHENKSFSTLQLWGLGRAADPVQNKKEGQKLKGASAIYENEEQEKAAKEAGNEIEAYTIEELDQIVEDYVEAAKRGVDAGFDFVEIQAAHSYFFHQFFEPSSNQRTDKYGGSIENRFSLVLKCIDRVCEEIGAHKVAVRISPWARYPGEKDVNLADPHPVASYGYLLGQLQKRASEGKEIAYVSVIEPRVFTFIDLEGSDVRGDNAFVRCVWKGVVLRAGNYTYDAPHFNQLVKDVEDGRTLVGFSRYFTSNPDLIYRLRDGKPLTPYHRPTFYAKDNWGYNTYNTAEGKNKFDEEAERARKPQPLKV